MDTHTITQVLVTVGVGGGLAILGGIWRTVSSQLTQLRADLNKHVAIVERFMGSATVELKETKRRVDEVERLIHRWHEQ